MGSLELSDLNRHSSSNEIHVTLSRGGEAASTVG